MTEIKVDAIQADIIYKALYYTALQEGVDIPESLVETYLVLAEQNPKETHVEHTVEVMEYLNDLIRDSNEYRDDFQLVEEED